MSKIRQQGMDWTTAYTDDNTAEQFLPATAWISASEVGDVRFIWELREAMTNFQVAPGYQTANVENSPDTATKVGALKNTDGVFFPTGFSFLLGSKTSQRAPRASSWFASGGSPKGALLARSCWGVLPALLLGASASSR